MGLFRKVGQAYARTGKLATGDYREEIAEAKRGRPDVDLEVYAADRGLEWLDHASPSGFGAVVPQYEELQFNVMRGTLPGGEYGILFHEVMTIGLRARAGTNEFPAISTTPIEDGNFMWIDGGRLATDTPDPWKTLGGHRSGFKAGFTVAAAHVPQAAGPIPAFRIDRRVEFPPHSFPDREKLDDRELDGWQLFTVKEANRDALDELLAGPLRGVLEAKPFLGSLNLVYWHGTVIARCLHYLDQPPDLDALAGILSLAAHELRAAGLAHAEPRPFSDRLPPPAWPTRTEPEPKGVEILGARVQRGGAVDFWKEPIYDPPLNFTRSEWQGLIRSAAARYAMDLEDPLAYHLAFPQMPVPGHAFAVLRGQLPGTTIDGRIALHTEKDLLAFNDGRNAVLLPAARGVADNRPSEERVAGSGLRIGVRDGIVAIWNRRSIPGHDLGDLDGLVASAVDLATARNLV